MFSLSSEGTHRQELHVLWTVKKRVESAAAASASRGPFIADIGQHYRGPDRDISKRSNKHGPFIVTDTNPYNHLKTDENEPFEMMSNIITNDEPSTDSSSTQSIQK